MGGGANRACPSSEGSALGSDVAEFRPMAGFESSVPAGRGAVRPDGLGLALGRVSSQSVGRQPRRVAGARSCVGPGWASRLPARSSSFRTNGRSGARNPGSLLGITDQGDKADLSGSGFC